VCSLLGILSHTSFTFHYLFFQLFLQYVNEPFASNGAASFPERLVPCRCSTSDNAITGQFEGPKIWRLPPAPPTVLLAITCFNFSITVDLVRSTSLFPCAPSLAA